jgi:Tfp pilus assembly major pilin PilA
MSLTDLSPREWITVTAVVAGVAALLAIIPWQYQHPVCTTKVVEMQTALAKSNDEMQVVAAAGTEAKCPVWRKRADILKDVAVVASACGPPQQTRGAARPQFDTEHAFYRRLVAEQCG